MNSHTTRRRDDRSAADPSKQSVHYDTDRRRNRSATVPSNSYDQRAYPPNDTRYNDPRLPSRSHRQDPHYPSAPAYPSYHPTPHPPPTSKAYQHASRQLPQHSSSGYHYPQPTSYQPSHPSSVYPVAPPSRRPQPEQPDPRASRRPPPPTHQPSYEQVSSGEEIPRPSRHPPRPSTQPLAPTNHTFWNPPQDMSSSRRYKDRDRDQERDRDKERDKPSAELDNRYRDKARAERHRERTTDARYQEPSRSRHHDRRKDSDTEGVLYSEQRNASKASLSGKEGYSARELSNGHRRHRTEDGTASTGRRHQPENTQNPITSVPSQSATVPQPDVQQTGEPPPAPRVMPVYLPPKAKSQRSHREARPSTTQGAQSGSDTERATGKHRMERTPSGPAVQRSDVHTSSSTRDRGNHDVSIGPRDDVKRPESKYGAHQDARQPLAPINVDIPLVTPGFNTTALPNETRASTVPQLVSIRAGQGPSDPHDAHFKSPAISHSDAPQEIVIHPPHTTSTPIVKSSSHTRPQFPETRTQSDRPILVEHSRTEPRGDDPPGQRMSIHDSGRALPTPISKPSYSRGNPETGADNPSSSFPHSRPPSRSAHRTASNNAVPPAVVGPRPLRSVSQGPQTNEPPTRPPSVAQNVPTASSVHNQPSVPPSPAHPTNSSPPKAGHAHNSLTSQPSPKHIQLHGVPSHSTPTQHVPSVPPSVHPTPTVVPQALTTSSRPSTRDGAYPGAACAHQQLSDRQPGPAFQQISNSPTVQASWVVQTPVTVRRAKISQEDKYLRANSETPHPQLRQVLSQDDDPFPRASSSMMKASQAITPSTPSQRNSPGTKGRDTSFGTPRGTLASHSPKSRSVKEAPTPEHVPRQNLPPHLVGPPQIAVVGATPVTITRDLPQGRVDRALLAPTFPAPTRTSRTMSNSQDQQPQPPQPVARSISSVSYQSQLAPAVHAPSLFQPYRPPSLPEPEDSGQFSPPPLPIPPPRGLEDSPPPPIDTRESEIIPTRAQSDAHPQNYVDFVPEVQSEMIHVPSQPVGSSQLPSGPSPPSTQSWQPGKLDSDMVPTSTLNESVAVALADTSLLKPAFALVDDVQVVHQEIIPILPSQSSASTRPRPKVTVEDVPEDSPALYKPILSSAPTVTPSVPTSKPVQPPQTTPVANANLTSKSTTIDQPGHKSSPQSRSKDPSLHRGTEPSVMPAAPPMPPPTSATAPTSRMPSSVPPTYPGYLPSVQVAPAQRATSHTVPSRTYQRAAEMLQASKLSTSAGTNPGAPGSVYKSTAAPVQTTTHNPVYATTGQHQLVSGAGVQGISTARLANASTSSTTHHPSATASVAKVVAQPTTTGSGPPVGALGLQIPALSTSNNTQLPSILDPSRQQSSRPGALSIPSLEATSTTVMSTNAVKVSHQEQPSVDSTRTRDVMPSASRNVPPSSHTYPISARPSTSSATQQPHVIPAQPMTHNRVVSLPVTSSSSATQKPSSPRKYSQPISSTTVSTQPFPSRPPVPEPQARVPASGHMFTPAPVRSARLPPPDRTNDPDVLRTPSSIAPSPMLNPTSNSVPQFSAAPVRARQTSTDSKDDKKKPSGLFDIFRTRTPSSKATDPPAVSTVTRATFDRVRAHPDAPVAPSTTTSVPRGVTLTSAPKEPNSAAPPAASTSTRVTSQSKANRVPGPFVIPPPTHAAREQRVTTPHIFTPFKLLTMHSKRNRTVSAASLDVCDGNTATNTVIGSPDHSTVSQVQPLPLITPPDVRDPLVATTEWRDREEAERRERRTNRILRPGVTFDIEEEPPSPAPGATSRRKKLIRRPTGRAATPGPLRG